MERLYRTGVHPGIAICMRRHGKLVMNRTLGYASGLRADEVSKPQVLELDSPICMFSASKAVTAMLVHKLAEDGYVHLLDPISYYIPAYAQRGKAHITIYQLLSHRGGVPRIDEKVSVEDAEDTQRILDLICAAEPSCPEGRLTEYHALTGGFIIAELVRVTTGLNIREYIDKVFRQPMGMRYFDYGLQGSDAEKAAVNYITGLPTGKIVNGILERAFGCEVDEATEQTNLPAFKKAVIPSANLYVTAEEISRFFQMMIDDGQWQGQQILDPLTVFRATRESTKAGIDKALNLPMRYSAGFMLGGAPLGMYGANSHYAFGHAGFSNIFCWGDPQRDISVSVLTTGKPILGPHVLELPRLVHAITSHCPVKTSFERRVPERPRAAAKPS